MEIKDPEIRNLYVRLERGLRHLEAQKKAGNRAAAEALRMIVEIISRGAAIVTEPGLTRARRAQLLKELLQELRKADPSPPYI